MTTMVPCHPPLSSGFNSLGKPNCHKLRNRYQSSPHSNITFHVKLTLFFILLSILLEKSARHASGQKVSFYSYFTCLFWEAVSNQHALTPAICQYFFTDAEIVLIELILDGGDGTMAAMFQG